MPFYQDIDPKDAHSPRMLERMLALRQQLEDEIPKRSLHTSLLLATWNIREFDAPAYGERLPEAFYYIAEIIDRFDLVAVQEVRRDLKALKKLVVRTFQTSVPTPISLLVIDLDDCQHSLRPAVWSSASLSQRRSIKRFPQILPDLCIYLLMSAIISGCGRDGLPRSDPAVRQILKQTFAIPSPYIPDNIDIAARLEDNNER